MKPILIYKGDDVCYNMLNFMAENFGSALEKLGCEVEYCDLINGGHNDIAGFVGREFAAMIGFHTKVFNIYLEAKGCYLHDLIKGPKFNFLFDHPIWEKDRYEHAPHDYYVLTHDRNYMNFIKRYFPGVKDAFLLPPGGALCKGEPVEKINDLVMVGTYVDYRGAFPLIRNSNMKGLANKFLLALRKDYNKTSDEVLIELLEREKINLSDAEFLQLLYELRPMVTCTFSYYREKIIESILNGGIPLTVYGSSWRESPFAGNSLLTIKDDLSPHESLKVLSESRMSLNIMSWHKDGFNERIPNSMLAKSVVISDKSTCLEEQYEDEKEIILFDLGEIDGLPNRIRGLIKNKNKASEIAERGYERALNEDTWESRAKLFLEYLEEL